MQIHGDSDAAIQMQAADYGAVMLTQMEHGCRAADSDADAGPDAGSAQMRTLTRVQMLTPDTERSSDADFRCRR